MRKNQVKSILNDLLDLRSERNPLKDLFIEKIFEMNLITGRSNRPKGDYGDVIEMGKEKHQWLIDRIKALGGNLKDFEGSKMIIHGKKEKIILKYKGEVFPDDRVY